MTDKWRSSALNHQNGEKHSDKEIQKKSCYNEPQKLSKSVSEQKQSRNKHEEACAWKHHCGFTRNGTVATETDVTYEN